ncbi:Hypothetical_protein [Hexamita inflata]|uniref:Hypothetical_protein n=1 Tax=Hexamita inflata TaxID=28002 RepID=A0AA86PAC5_9EUKA|nr:Hypothetical protein HINF_LOCUS22731 [Hexamita inflata]
MKIKYVSSIRLSLMACLQPYRSLTAAQHFESGILPSATDLAEPHLRKQEAARNEKRNRMNPSSITLNKAGIPAMPLQLQRRTPSQIVQMNKNEISSDSIINSTFKNNISSFLCSINQKWQYVQYVQV